MSSSPTGTLSDGRWIKKGPTPYTKPQILEWLSVIGYPVTSKVKSQIENDTFPADLENLHQVSRRHYIAFPFENTQMHYTARHTLDIDPQVIYQRLVVDRKGSYCFGKGGLLFGMLRGLGYRVYAAQARTDNTDFAPASLGATKDSPSYTPPLHMMLLVQPIEGSNVTYLCDTAFGGPGLSRPILLSDAEDNVVLGATPTEMHRLTRAPFAGGVTEKPSPLWRLEVMRKKPGRPSEWKAVYTFDETEHFQEDFELANFYVVNYPYGTPFYNHVVVMKYFWIDTEGDIDEEMDVKDLLIGMIILFGNRITRNMGTRSETLKVFKDEGERTAAIKEYFGIDIETEGKVDEIIRTPAALPTESMKAEKPAAQEQLEVQSMGFTAFRVAAVSSLQHMNDMLFKRTIPSLRGYIF
ncbi:cysteine proteinase [Marasmius fiardii PR-910]|nr:cysteine proteinase [Marasmius fiardii PR-910]